MARAGLTIRTEKASLSSFQQCPQWHEATDQAKTCGKIKSRQKEGQKQGSWGRKEPTHEAGVSANWKITEGGWGADSSPRFSGSYAAVRSRALEQSQRAEALKRLCIVPQEGKERAREMVRD